MNAIFDACQASWTSPWLQMRKGDRLALVALLKEKGVFFTCSSVPYVAERMGVSKYTIYNYLNELERIS